MNHHVPAVISQALEEAGVRASWHVCDIDRSVEVGSGSDEPVVTASTFKVMVLLELARQASAGELSLTQRIKIPSDRRTIGPTGLSVMLDDVEMSARDLAFWMMCVSDNTATDVLQELVGTDRVNKTMADLGLAGSVLEGDCKDLLEVLVADAGGAENLWSGMTTERFAANRSLNALTTNRTTAREMTRLLSMIWRDEAGDPEACAEVRRIMPLQVWPHRLSSGFGDGVKVSGKTGTLVGIRNEVGVVEFPDKSRYAAAVFVTTPDDWSYSNPKADAVIGTIARLAIDHLKESS